MIIVTGAAGFIGSCLVSKLNSLGNNNLILVDHISDLKQKNLENKSFQQYFEKKDFLEKIKSNKIESNVSCVIHLGACSSTTETNARYLEENNYQYSCELARWAMEHKVRFIYASSAATYGDGALGYSDDHAFIPKLKPLNLYGESKQKFDLWILNQHLEHSVVGLKYFNVFGPNEYHKGDMRSVLAKAYERVVSEGRMGLFKSYLPQYKDGEQRRDFLYVKDAVDMTLFLMENPHQNGIFNIGTGVARTWNDVAHALFAATGQKPQINYVDIPETIRDKYQYFTEANIEKLQKAGYQKSLWSLEDAVKDYVFYLKDHRYL